MYENMEEANRESLINDSVGRKILDSAIRIINNEGYENLTIRRVAKESGCSNSAIYQRFEDKNALARAVAAWQAKPFLHIIDEIYSKDMDFLINLNRITMKLLEQLYSFDVESVYMQTLYRGELKMEEDPFITRMDAYLKKAMARGEIDVAHTGETAFLISTSFWGLIQRVRADKNCDINHARRLLDAQNRIIYNGIKAAKGEDSLWDMLRGKGVDVDKALERLKGNKEAYKSFLVEFFEDPDFESLGEEIKAGNARNAFEYAHGLKGMAANLGLDTVHNQLSVLVEILRPGGLEGAAEAYEGVMDACNMVTVLL